MKYFKFKKKIGINVFDFVPLTIIFKVLPKQEIMNLKQFLELFDYFEKIKNLENESEFIKGANKYWKEVKYKDLFTCFGIIL